MSELHKKNNAKTKFSHKKSQLSHNSFDLYESLKNAGDASDEKKYRNLSSKLSRIGLAKESKKLQLFQKS